MFCPKCGKEIPEKSRFCTNCGRELVASKKPAKRTNKKLMLISIIAFLVLATGIFSWFLLHKPVVKTPEQVSQEPVQRKEILDYTKETEVKKGFHLVLRVDCSRLPSEVCREAVQRTANIIANRLRLFCSDEKVLFGVYMAGNDEIIVQLPSTLDIKRVLSLIGKTGYIEFKVVSDDAEKIRQALKGNIPHGYELRYLNGQPLLLKKEPFTVVLGFHSKGVRISANATAANVGKRLAIVLDGKVVSAPVIREAFSSFYVEEAVEEANDLSLILRGGALPVPVMIEEESTISGVIGFDFQGTQGMIVQVRFSAPITAEILREKLYSQGIPAYIQMLGRGEKDYLIWLQTSPAQTEKVIKEFKNISGDLLRIEAISERIKPDIVTNRRAISFQEQKSALEKESPPTKAPSKETETTEKITIASLTKNIPDTDYFIEQSKIFDAPFDIVWAAVNKYFAELGIVTSDPDKGILITERSTNYTRDVIRQSFALVEKVSEGSTRVAVKVFYYKYVRYDQGQEGWEKTSRVFLSEVALRGIEKEVKRQQKNRRD